MAAITREERGPERARETQREHRKRRGREVEGEDQEIRARQVEDWSTLEESGRQDSLLGDRASKQEFLHTARSVCLVINKAKERSHFGKSSNEPCTLLIFQHV